MRYTNRHFTYLLTYLQTTVEYPTYGLTAFEWEMNTPARTFLLRISARLPLTRNTHSVLMTIQRVCHYTTIISVVSELWADIRHDPNAARYAYTD